MDTKKKADKIWIYEVRVPALFSESEVTDEFVKEMGEEKVKEIVLKNALKGFNLSMLKLARVTKHTPK